MMGWIHGLYNNVIYQLYAAPNQPKDKRREPTLRVITSQIVLIQDPIMQ